MAAQSNHSPSTFWFGFALGTMATGLSLYLFGTKKGRTTLKKIMELTENLEENAFSLFQELEEHVMPSKDEGVALSEKTGGIESVMHRMKNLGHETEKTAKRFFTKE